jgi:hypothetical protein
MVLLGATRPAAAELKYTVRLEVNKSGSPATPMAAAIGQMLAQLAPEGAVDATYIVGQRGLRAEINKPMAAMPAGTVILWTPSAPGELVLLNPARKTYVRTSIPNASEAMATAGVSMKASVAAPVKSDAILGLPTEKSTITINLEFAMMAQAAPEARAAMAAMQRDSTLTGEVWTVPGRFDEYAAVVSRTGIADLLKSTGLSGKVKGFVMRQRVSVGGYEVRSDVTKIAEEAVPASTFEIPAGYTRAQ